MNDRVDLDLWQALVDFASYVEADDGEYVQCGELYQFVIER